MAESTDMAVLQCNVPNPIHRGIENWKMYAIKQNQICAEYLGMVPMVSAGLSDVLPDKMALASGIMFWYPTQILTCIA